MTVSRKPARIVLICAACFLLLFACSRRAAGPVDHYFKKDGVQWRTSKIYGYPGGKRTLAQVDTYKEDWLQDSKVYYELWPNDEWKLVSKTGFYVVKGGKSLLNNDSLQVPDNIIYIYFDQHFKEIIEVYKAGRRIPYTAGRPDGYESMQFLVDTPGVYRWKNGKEYFYRAFTEAELESNRRINNMLKYEAVTDTAK